MRVLALLAAALLPGACVTEQNMYVPTEAEIQACLAQGGAIEPAFALDAYVCLLPADPPKPAHVTPP